MRARGADSEGFVVTDGVKIHYEVHGAGPANLLLLPTWTVVHKGFWKMQVPYLARHFRVITYDGPGNGASDRPTDPAAYHHRAQGRYALDVLDASGTERAVLVSLSRGSIPALTLAADHTDRVDGAIFVAPSVDLADYSESRRTAAQQVSNGHAASLPRSQVPMGGQDPPTHWAKAGRQYWRDHYEDFLWFFFGQCFPEPHSTKAIEDCVGWGLETSGDVLVADSNAGRVDRATAEAWCARVRCPVLVIHGDDDRVSPLARGRRLAELTGGELQVIAGGGHLPVVRDPVMVNRAIRHFVERLTPPPAGSTTWTRARVRPRRVLYLSSPIGLGHARRDLAITRALRERLPDVQVDWLAQDPVTRVLERAGERIHPASRWLASESAHIQSECVEHDLHCFQAIRRMDEVLHANFMVFHDVVESGHYDLVVGDESWDVDHHLHENPELKRFAYAWFTDFVGWLPVEPGDEREAMLTADYNAEMIEHIARTPRVRDRSIFVGDPDDVVPYAFGPDLPSIRTWTEQHYDFAGYVTGFDPAALGDTGALRRRLGYADDERVCIATVGGSGVGAALLERVIAAFPQASREVPNLRLVVVCGPRIDPASLPAVEGVTVRSFVPDLHLHLACCDVAIVQGGLTTCMELTAAGRPFIYIPLRRHFEQNLHVPHRLARYGAGHRLEYEDATPDALATAIATTIGRPTAYLPVQDGSARAAALLAELL